MGPWSRRILHAYWYRLPMVARVGGYYGASFQKFRDVIQGDPLHHTILKVVVDSVVHQ